LTLSVPWKSFTDHAFPESDVGIVCVLRNSMGQEFTIRVDGKESVFLGLGDNHDTEYEQMAITLPLFSPATSNTSTIQYSITVYPSKLMEPRYLTAKPAIYASVVFITFTFAFIIFITYDCFVEQKQKKITAAADKAQAVVHSLFPETVGQRLMEEVGQNNDKLKKNPLQMFQEGAMGVDRSTAPIAEFFVDTTVMFGDIRGFTAWSSR
jgi:hypothetical protein